MYIELLNHNHKDRIKQAKAKANDKTRHKVIDLRKLTDLDDNTFICEYCDCQLIPYFDVKGQYLTAPGGKLFQCGKCGQIKDTSGQGILDMKRPEQLTTRGDNFNNLFITHWRKPSKPAPKQFDIEPGDDAQLKAQGFHIVRTRITVNGKILRDDYDNS